MDVGKKVIACDKCSAEFLIESVHIQECRLEIRGEKLLLKYFICPACNKIYKVFLVNEQKYQEMVDDLLLTKEAIRRLQGKGDIYTLYRLQKTASDIKRKIQSHVSSNNTKYDGTFTFAASKNNQKEIIYLPRDKRG